MDFIPRLQLWKPHRKLERFKAHVPRKTRKRHLTVTGSWEPESQLWKPQRLVRKEHLPLSGGAGNPRRCLPWFWSQKTSKRGDWGVALPPTERAEPPYVVLRLERWASNLTVVASTGNLSKYRFLSLFPDIVNQSPSVSPGICIWKCSLDDSDILSCLFGITALGDNFPNLDCFPVLLWLFTPW